MPGRHPLPEDRPCTKCGLSAPDVVFHYRNDKKRQINRRRSHCQSCHNVVNLRWSKKHPESHRLYQNIWKHQNGHIRENRLKEAGPTFSRQEWHNLITTYDFTCLRCKRKEPEIKLTIDHVIPVSKGGTNHISNIQPLCHSCNSRKRTKTVDYRHFLPSQK